MVCTTTGFFTVPCMPFLVFLLSFDRKNHKIGYLPSIQANFVFSDPRKDSYEVRRV